MVLAMSPPPKTRWAGIEAEGHFRPGGFHQPVDVFLVFDEGAHVVVIGKGDALASRPFGKLRQLSAIGIHLIAGELGPVVDGHPDLPLHRVGAFGVDDAGRPQRRELLGLLGNCRLFHGDIGDEEIAGTPAAAKRDVEPFKEQPQALRVLRHAAATLDAGIANFARLLKRLFHGVGGGEIRQVIVLPGDGGDADLDTHLLILCRAGRPCCCASCLWEIEPQLTRCRLRFSM
jgi:hypothetical protein